MLCIRCGKRNAIFQSEDQQTALESHGLGVPPFPPGLCFQCMKDDPELWASLHAWTDKVQKEAVDHLRALATRPLEAVDRLVEAWRKPAA